MKIAIVSERRQRAPMVKGIDYGGRLVPLRYYCTSSEAIDALAP